MSPISNTIAWWSYRVNNMFVCQNAVTENLSKIVSLQVNFFTGCVFETRHLGGHL